MKIILIENEKYKNPSLENELLNLGYEVIGPFTESTKALEAFNNQNPDLAILGIKLNNSPLDGIELIQVFKNKKNIPFIFLSKLPGEETRKRIKLLCPNYFLLRPIVPNQIDFAIDFALNNFMEKNGQNHDERSIYHPFEAKSDFFFIKQNNKYLRISLLDIRFLKAAGSQTEIFLSNNRYVVSTHLSDLLKQLCFEKLLKCHRSFAVNLDALLSFDHDSLFVEYNNHKIEISIGKTYRKNVYKKLKIIKSK